MGETVPGHRLPTFTRAIPRSQPAWKAPGLERAGPETLARYGTDGFRFPPYTYEEVHCLVRSDAPDEHSRRASARVCRAVEREVLMGFKPHHTRALLGRSARTRQDSWWDDSLRCAALGNAYHTLSVATLLGLVLFEVGFPELRMTPVDLQRELAVEVTAVDARRPRDRESASEPSEIEVAAARVALAPGDPTLAYAQAEEHASYNSEHGRPFDASGDFCGGEAAGSLTPESRIVHHYIRRADARGTEIRLDLGQSFQSKPSHRVGVRTKRWTWRHVLSRAVKRRAHINVLELVAVDMSLRWRLRSQARGGRSVHLVDSQVVLSILSKGRCRSPRLLPGLRRVGARLIGGNLLVTFAFVTSELNPADEPSRDP